MSASKDQSLRVLVLERDEATAAYIAAQLPESFDCKFVTTTAEAEALIDSHLPDLFFCADDLVEESGLMFLARTHKEGATTQRILMVPDPDGELFFTALREIPNLSYLSKPLDQRIFHRLIRHLLWEPVSNENKEPTLSDAAEVSALEDPPVITSTSVVLLETNPAEAVRLIALLPWGFRHKLAVTTEQAENYLNAEPTDLFLCSDNLPAESGLMFLARTQKEWPTTKRILMVLEPDAEFFFQASREMPLLNYLNKPVEKPELMHILRKGMRDLPFADLDEPPKDEPDQALNKEFLRIGTWALLILIAAAIAGAALALVYEMKCRFGLELFSN